ncbi:MAG: histidine kinase, partial [Chitinophagaceae bacterium]|nr:histidine kinase [Chitinophagaceae bacterium]
AFLTSFFLVLVATPSLWYWYHYQQKRKDNLQALEQKLGHSTAQLDQLRTQINPHFLFNALNTVYGLAITENAPQTSDAIEKISEMMRFMLRENQEAFIPLEKDLDYLRNYIAIQQMRLGAQSPIELVTELPEDIAPTLTIAPMLMIPFVENAFKHGISMQAHSFIHLLIRVEGEKLTFSLHNSTHDRIWLNDPEKNNHGIGLSNVKQRLNLLYPDKHLLSVKEDDKSYKVELTILL